MAPYRTAFTRAEGDPQPLHYLDSEANRREGALDIQLQVLLQTTRMKQAGQAGASISRTSYRQAYRTVAQMMAHHTVNGCNLQPGDLFGTGTLSGPALDQAAALIELTEGEQISEGYSAVSPTPLVPTLVNDTQPCACPDQAD